MVFAYLLKVPYKIKFNAKIKLFAIKKDKK